MAGLSHHRAVERSGVLMSARRLIAYVLHQPERPRELSWLYTVEERVEGKTAVWLDYYPDAIDAVEEAERIALKRGYGLDWRGGFVAHGVPVETSERGAQEA